MIKHKPFVPGDVVGRLTLNETWIGPDAKNTRRRWWRVTCKCGAVVVMMDQSLKAGRIVSCGCYAAEKCRVLGKRSASWKKGRHPLALERYILTQYKCSAKARKLSFELSLEQFIELMHQPCAYCGCPEQPHPVSKFLGLPDAIRHYNGVDRVDNTLSYTSSNCVTCCGRCNEMKNSMGLDTFKQHVKQIYEHLQLAGFVGRLEQYDRPAIR